MSQKIKFALPFLAIAVVFIFSGCGQKSGDNIPPATLQDESSAAFDSLKADMPEPTGDVDDTIDAILDESELEKEEVQAEENEALNSIDDEAETNDFGQSYDENEF